MKNTKKTKKAANAENKQPRHRIHSVDKHYYSIWFDLELMAKLKVFSKKAGKAVSEVVTENMEKLVAGTKLTPEAKEWIKARRIINETRKE